jgi:hypothetical protein
VRGNTSGLFRRRIFRGGSGRPECIRSVPQRRATLPSIIKSILTDRIENAFGAPGHTSFLWPIQPCEGDLRRFFAIPPASLPSIRRILERISFCTSLIRNRLQTKCEFLKIFARLGLLITN